VSYRRLTKIEREALYAMLDTADKLRAVLVSLRGLGWETPDDLLRDWDNGAEVVRALATDTHSLVRES
jgi:hypothetical protein